MKKKKPEKARNAGDKPKARNVWEINPKTRIGESEKEFNRGAEKAVERRAIDEIIDFFGVDDDD